MRSGNEKHAADTWCTGKGFEEAWAHFRPSKPCVSLSTDGIIIACLRIHTQAVYAPFRPHRRAQAAKGRSGPPFSGKTKRKGKTLPFCYMVEDKMKKMKNVTCRYYVTREMFQNKY